MCVCVYAYINLCVCVYVYAHMSGMHVCACVYRYSMYRCVCLCVHMHMSVYLCVCEQPLTAVLICVCLQKRGLENSLSDAKHWHDIELQNLGSVISKLEAELSDIRSEIEQQCRDYETLLGNKMRLELEIGTYHGILDGEESRYQPSM